VNVKAVCLGLKEGIKKGLQATHVIDNILIFKTVLLSMKSSGTYCSLICLIGKDVEESGRCLIFINFPALFGETEKHTKPTVRLVKILRCAIRYL
jgi:hypothetical protein